MKNILRNALILEDDRMMSSLIASLLEQAKFQVVRAHSVTEAKKAVKNFEPDVALLDIDLGYGPTGIDFAKMLRKDYPGIGILILTRYPDSRTAGVTEAIPLGCGFLRKENIGDVEVLLEAVELVLADMSTLVRNDQNPKRPLANLSVRQIELLRMLAQGLTNLEISDRLGVSTSAVEQRLGTIFRVLGIEAIQGVSPRAEAMRIFISSAGIPERS